MQCLHTRCHRRSGADRRAIAQALRPRAARTKALRADHSIAQVSASKRACSLDGCGMQRNARPTVCTSSS